MQPSFVGQFFLQHGKTARQLRHALHPCREIVVLLQNRFAQKRFSSNLLRDIPCVAREWQRSTQILRSSSGDM